MADLFEYLKWRGDIPFSEGRFTEIDGLILSAFCYIDAPAELLQEMPFRISELQKQMHHLPKDVQRSAIRNETDLKLLKTLAQSPRFRDVKVLSFSGHLDDQTETQFAAYCLELCEGKLAIVYRGTDHSITGWKEDFNMSFMDKIPGQLMAADFLKTCATRFSGDLYICGHSKGGNLAVYAATTCPKNVEVRIRDVYNYDGPGFSQNFVKRASYKRMIDRLHTFVPESSIVGILFIHEEPYEFVGSTNVGVAQHEPYSWKVMGASIVRCSRSESSNVMDQALKQWLEGMTKQEREAFVENLFGLLQESDASSLEDIAKLKTVFAAGKQYSSYSEKDKARLQDAAKAFRLAITQNWKKKK
ncbi:MAG: DUF2974 domain-containing protein [Lachnospiraceae bacterium]|nr:DUF2974 domain-containing protein [Lachnospiraceae bacterium]